MRRQLIPLLMLLSGMLLPGQTTRHRSEFAVKYIAEGTVYIDGGRNDGLAPGTRLTVRRQPAAKADAEPLVIAELEVTAVAASSAACEIKNTHDPIHAGDRAYLSEEDRQAIQLTQSSEEGKKYAQVVTFTDGDPLEEEQRAAVPHSRLPEVNRARGRIGFEYGAIRQGEGSVTTQVGLVLRADVTRIGGSYWNLSGYWRGRRNLRSTGGQQPTISDLMNRTYHLTFFYNNPASSWMAGAGRLFVPWASSLQTIDGGYIARRFDRRFTAGAFAGSTPDPTSWNYNPDRQILGSFVNYTSGSFESVRLSTTGGIAVSRISWKPERNYAFFENVVNYKTHLSVFHNMEADRYRGNPQPAENGIRVSRSFVTLRVQPVSRLSLDLSHNYFRDVPTFDPRLVGTGLVDKLLFQGGSAGFHLELPRRFAVYSSVGRSSRSGDAKRSLNQMYGITKSDLLGTGIRADVRYSSFDGSFGKGTYRGLSVARQIGDSLRLNLMGGDQNLNSGLTTGDRARFVTGDAEWSLGRHYFLGGGYTIYRSETQDYNQLYFNLGYRF